MPFPCSEIFPGSCIATLQEPGNVSGYSAGNPLTEQQLNVEEQEEEGFHLPTGWDPDAPPFALAQLPPDVLAHALCPQLTPWARAQLRATCKALRLAVNRHHAASTRTLNAALSLHDMQQAAAHGCAATLDSGTTVGALCRTLHTVTTMSRVVLHVSSSAGAAPARCAGRAQGSGGGGGQMTDGAGDTEPSSLGLALQALWAAAPGRITHVQLHMHAAACSALAVACQPWLWKALGAAGPQLTHIDLFFSANSAAASPDADPAEAVETDEQAWAAAAAALPAGLRHLGVHCGGPAAPDGPRTQQMLAAHLLPWLLDRCPHLNSLELCCGPSGQGPSSSEAGSEATDAPRALTLSTSVAPGLEHLGVAQLGLLQPEAERVGLLQQLNSLKTSISPREAVDVLQRHCRTTLASLHVVSVHAGPGGAGAPGTRADPVPSTIWAGLSGMHALRTLNIRGYLLSQLLALPAACIQSNAASSSSLSSVPGAPAIGWDLRRLRHLTVVSELSSAKQLVQLLTKGWLSPNCQVTLQDYWLPSETSAQDLAAVTQAMAAHPAGVAWAWADSMGHRVYDMAVQPEQPLVCLSLWQDGADMDDDLCSQGIPEVEPR